MTLFSGDYPIPAPASDDICSHPDGRYVRITYADGSLRVGWECSVCLIVTSHRKLGMKRAIKEFGLTEWEIKFMPRRATEVNLEHVKAHRLKMYKAQKRKWWTWYNGYLASPYWLAKRQAVLERDDYTCCGCKGEANQVHHLTYERVGREALEDLVSICAACHAYHHEEMDRRIGRDGSHREAAE